MEFIQFCRSALSQRSTVITGPRAQCESDYLSSDVFVVGQIPLTFITKWNAASRHSVIAFDFVLGVDSKDVWLRCAFIFNQLNIEVFGDNHGKKQ